jgi:hypothetical protein
LCAIHKVYEVLTGHLDRKVSLSCNASIAERTLTWPVEMVNFGVGNVIVSGTIISQRLRLDPRVSFAVSASRSMETKMTSKFNIEDELKINEPGQNIPYFSIKLTPEQAKLVEGKRFTFYEVEGQTMFDVRGLDGSPTGEVIIVVMFVDN